MSNPNSKKFAFSVDALVSMRSRQQLTDQQSSHKEDCSTWQIYLPTDIAGESARCFRSKVNRSRLARTRVAKLGLGASLNAPQYKPHSQTWLG